MERGWRTDCGWMWPASVPRRRGRTPFAGPQKHRVRTGPSRGYADMSGALTFSLDSLLTPIPGPNAAGKDLPHAPASDGLTNYDRIIAARKAIETENGGSAAWVAIRDLLVETLRD